MPAESAQDLDAMAQAAGDSVRDHVRALLGAAQKRARAIEADAEGRAREQTDAALQAARDVLARVEAIEEQLGELVGDLREEAAALPGADELEAQPPAPAQAPVPLTALQQDVNQIAANLRAVMEGARALPDAPAKQPEDDAAS